MCKNLHFFCNKRRQALNSEAINSEAIPRETIKDKALSSVCPRLNPDLPSIKFHKNRDSL